MNALPAIGASLGTATYQPDALSLFLFGVAHWTAHRIHYDVEQARAEGNPGLLVTAQLMTSWQLQLLGRWSGSQHDVRSLTERNVGAAYAGDVLTVSGEVTGVEAAETAVRITCALAIRAGERPVVTSEAVLLRTLDR